MRKFVGWSFIFSILAFNPLWSFEADRKRTDGPEGSEYGDPGGSSFDGDIQLGLNFGATINEDTDQEASFTLGADVDFRPYDIFGFRLAYLHAVTKPRSAVVNLMPTAHFQFANALPYLLAGPGIGIVSINGDRKIKFNIGLGGGLDFMFNDRFGLGMFYQYNILFDTNDLHIIGARLIIGFPGNTY